jgi:predicted transposase YdaD
MPITYDIETDYLYNKGIEKGIEKDRIEVICNARKEGLSVDSIARIVKLSVEQVSEILKQNKID